MKINLLGGIVKIDEIQSNVDISNGTIMLTNSDVVVDANKYENITLTGNNIILEKNMGKWKYIKCCLKLAWNKLVNG